MRNGTVKLLSATALLSVWPVSANAQQIGISDLLAMEMGSLESEIQTRYDAGLLASQNEAIISADSPRYLWALETKVQCAIALGFLKTSTRDEVSISKCQSAYNALQRIAPPRVVAVPPPAPTAICNERIPAMVFFEFDSANIEPTARQALQVVADNYEACGWQSLAVVGHTDQAGSGQYNVGLSEERAQSVVRALRNMGVPNSLLSVTFEGESNPRVPLADGSRSPQNRRVELEAK